jgi:fumarate hydratase class II
LNPTIGYDKASDVAKTALKEDKTVREVVVEKGYLTEAEADEVLDPESMTHRGILGED